MEPCGWRDPPIFFLIASSGGRFQGGGVLQSVPTAKELCAHHFGLLSVADTRLRGKMAHAVVAEWCTECDLEGFKKLLYLWAMEEQSASHQAARKVSKCVEQEYLLTLQ